MLEIVCNQCGASVTTRDGSDPDSLLHCGCCPQDHHHGQAANACSGAGLRHEGAPCPSPEGGASCIVVTGPGEPCPGGHCGLGVEGCTVCRPITITVLAGTVQVG